ncbi:MAG TPA: hypothetical protein VGN15_02965, partial [Ktedonobacteraceae bacterium]|nr:hypothetical protein [Ktedonobacteraceae bacterium]
MTTTYPSPHGPQEPEQTPPQEIRVSRVVRRNVPSAGQTPIGDNPARPILSTPTAHPVLPDPPQQNGHMRLSTLAANNVDFLPTAALPAHNDDIPVQIEQPQPPVPAQQPKSTQ